MSNKLTPYQELFQKSLSHTEQLTAIERCILFYGVYTDEESGIEAAEHYAALRTAAMQLLYQLSIDGDVQSAAAALAARLEQE